MASVSVIPLARICVVAPSLKVIVESLTSTLTVLMKFVAAAAPVKEVEESPVVTLTPMAVVTWLTFVSALTLN